MAATKKTAAKKATAKPEPTLAERLTAAREKGHTCRSLASACTGEPCDPGTDTWKLAGHLDRVSRGAAIRPADQERVTAVLKDIETGKLVPPVRRSPRSEVKALLASAESIKTARGKQEVIDEALRLLG